MTARFGARQVVACLIALACCAGACTGRPLLGEATGVSCRPPARALSFVVHQFGFVRQDPASPAIVAGFDIDGRVSTESDVMSCRRLDFTSPDGERGVDNQLAVLLPIVDRMTGGALDGAIQSAINNGQLLLAVTVDGVDSRCDDSQVTLRFQRVSGMPFIGSDMFIDPGQTFDLLRSEQVTEVTATIRNRAIEAGPFDLALPVAVLDARLTIVLHDARVRLRFTDDDGLRGVVGGGIARDEFVPHVRSFNIPMALMASVESSLRLFADLRPTGRGECAQLSAAMEIHGRQAFINP